MERKDDTVGAQKNLPQCRTIDKQGFIALFASSARYTKGQRGGSVDDIEEIAILDSYMI